MNFSPLRACFPWWFHFLLAFKIKNVQRWKRQKLRSSRRFRFRYFWIAFRVEPGFQSGIWTTAAASWNRSSAARFSSKKPIEWRFRADIQQSHFRIWIWRKLFRRRSLWRYVVWEISRSLTSLGRDGYSAGAGLRPVDWKDAKLPPVIKNIYCEAPEVTSRSGKSLVRYKFNNWLFQTLRSRTGWNWIKLFWRARVFHVLSSNSRKVVIQVKSWACCTRTTISRLSFNRSLGRLPSVDVTWYPLQRRVLARLSA